jgi:dihydrolipoamide dehydrogenase
MMDPKDCDFLVVGAGPAGYVGAIRAAQLGLQTVLVEKENVGGLCLNHGCIPSKTLLMVSQLRKQLAKAPSYGLAVEQGPVDLSTLRERKQKVVSQLVNGVRYLLDKNGVLLVRGTARLIDAHHVAVDTAEGEMRFRARNILLATGSTPIRLSGLDPDGELIIGSRDALEVPSIPARMGIVGGGYIGIEFATLYRSLGSEVTVVEMMPRILPFLDGELASIAHRALVSQGVKIKTSSKVGEAKRSEHEVTVTVQGEKGTEKILFDTLLVAVGLKPNASIDGLVDAGVQLDSAGFVRVDGHMRTTSSTVFAAGDVAGQPLLAHKGSHEGMLAAEAAAGKGGRLDRSRVPYAVFCEPELAGVGLTTEDATQQGLDFLVGRFPLRAVGRAIATGETHGIVKVLAEKSSGRLLGLHVAGDHASELVAAMAVAVKADLRVQDLATIPFVHPTLSEALGEAAMDALGKSIHVFRRSGD